MQMNALQYATKHGSATLYSVTGVVLGSDKQSETQIWGGGGGGRILDGSGYISQGPIHSRTIASHDFWLSTPDGKEKHVHVANYHVPIREGHKVTAFFAKSEKPAKEVPYGLYIHNTGDSYELTAADVLLRSLELQKMTGKTVLLTIVTFVLVLLVFKTLSTAALAAFVMLVVRACLKDRNWRADRRRLQVLQTQLLDKVPKQSFG